MQSEVTFDICFISIDRNKYVYELFFADEDEEPRCVQLTNQHKGAIRAIRKVSADINSSLMSISFKF